MSYSIQRETSDGTLGTIDLSIEYIDQTDISVYVDDVIIDKVGGSTTYLWDWINADSISITPDVADGLVVMIKRSTPFDALYHIFTDSAVFSDRSMDENFRQVLYLSQEAIEGQGATDFYSDLDMHGYTIKNSGAAVDADDLIPLGQYQADASGAYQSRLGAEAARNAALVSQNAALASQNAAAMSEDNADTSEANALSSANTATSQATIATTKAGEAAYSAALAVSAYDSFDDRYLGAKTNDPTVDNDGNALLVGALYWNSVGNTLQVYDGVIWQPTYLSTDGDIIGPASAIDNAIALFDQTTGKLLKVGPLITASSTDTTAGRMLKVGDFGVGTPIPTTNLNTLTGTGWFACGDVTGTPGPSYLGWWVHQIDSGTGAWKNQTAWQQGNPASQHVRSSGDGTTWGAWNLVVFSNSPALTGVPTAPTAADGTSTTQIATTAFATTAAVNAASFVSSVKANTDSPALTGVPTAPTAAVGTNTTQLATTAFVQASISGLGIGQTWQDVSGSRSESTNYTNSTGRPIQVNINSASTTGSPTVTILSITVDGVVAAYCPSYTGNVTQGGFASVTVPDGSVYSAVVTNGNIGKWVELR